MCRGRFKTQSGLDMRALYSTVNGNQSAEEREIDKRLALAGKSQPIAGPAANYMGSRVQLERRHYIIEGTPIFGGSGEQGVWWGGWQTGVRGKPASRPLSCRPPPVMSVPVPTSSTCHVVPCHTVPQTRHVTPQLLHEATLVIGLVQGPAHLGSKIRFRGDHAHQVVQASPHAQRVPSPLSIAAHILPYMQASLALWSGCCGSASMAPGKLGCQVASTQHMGDKQGAKLGACACML